MNIFTIHGGKGTGAFKDDLSTLDKWIKSRFNLTSTDLRNKEVLEIGCGKGGFCVYAALAGASRVVGLDLDEKLIAPSRQNIHQYYPELESNIELKSLELKQYNRGTFDMVFSKNAFEHVEDLEEMLEEIKHRLNPNGRLYASFGPLWNAPFGDHRRFHRKLFKVSGRKIPQIVFPWSHLIIPESTFVRWINRSSSIEPITSIYAGINKRSFSDYDSAFKNSGLSIIKFEKNKSHLTSKIFNVLGKFPGLTELCTNSITVVLEKK